MPLLPLLSLAAVLWAGLCAAALAWTRPTPTPATPEEGNR